MASSQGNVIPNEINEEAKKFFTGPDRVQAQLFLNSKLEESEVECSISSALTTLYTYENLLWSSPITPAGISSMVISSKDIFANEALYNRMVLDLSIKNEISKQVLTKLTKTQVLFPKEIDGMMQRLDAVRVLSNLFFGESILLV